MATRATMPEAQALKAAQNGDEGAFEALLQPYRGELHAHCYRMLGSAHDADDAMQEAYLRAWRGLARFEGRSSLRSWLYTIATNTCLNQIQKRPKRVLPVDYGPKTDPGVGPGEPLVESVWIEPYPEEMLALADDTETSPDASFELRESVELAFVAALQFLPANQRAALILREVLGFSAKEVAEALDTSVQSINSALQRARKTIDDKLPEQSQQKTLQQLGDDEVTKIVEQYMQAMMSDDIDTVVSLLAEDAAWAMPPLASWFGGHDDIREWLRTSPLQGIWKWKQLPCKVNGQAATAAYTWSDEDNCFVPFSINVLTFEGDKIKEVVSFITRASDAGNETHYPDERPSEAKVADLFQRAGMPTRLDA